MALFFISKFRLRVYCIYYKKELVVEVSTIEFNTNSNNLGLLKNFPTEILGKLNISSTSLNGDMKENIEVVIISGDSVDKVQSFVDNLGGKFEDLGYGYGIVEIPIDKLQELATSPLIQYIEFPKSLYLTDSQSNAASCIPESVSAYNLDGQGVLVGFIDTGIDYTHPAFINDDGTTRIEYIYDLDQGGKIFDKNMINEALKSNNPFSIVNSQDIVGHGTHVAGIACAGGKIDTQFYGVAPKSSIAMVKVARSRFALSTQVMRGLKFLVDKSRELNLPLAVNISLSTNDGAHNGSSLLEQYILVVALLQRVSIAIAAGNEGEASHHIAGNLEKENNIYFNIGDAESIIGINLYKSLLPEISIELVAPNGSTTGEIFLAEGFRSGRIGNSNYDIYDTGPKPFDINGEVGILLRGINSYVASGQWRLIIRTLNEYKGVFNMWLPISEGLNVTTRFANPTVYNTLGIPATVRNVISVGSYNYLTNNISPFSGQGQPYTGQNIKPDVVAPGENIYSTIPNESYDRKTGTSMATPNVTGICALMMQWGIVKNNDPLLFGERLKYFLIEGAKKGRRDISYPDSAWGYGTACLYNSLQLTAESLGNRDFKLIDSLRQQEATQNTSQPTNTQQNSTVQNGEREFLLVEIGNQSQLQQVLNIPNVDGVMISGTFAILITPPNRINELRNIVNNIIEFSLIPIFTLNQITPIEASGAPQFNNNPYLRLNGRGVLVGIVDTGIDYLSEEFQREDGTSRIFRLWDQTLEASQQVQGIRFGREFTEEEITNAISAKTKGQDPYSIVPTKDEIGHGTMTAGIIGGRGINSQLKGVASDCEFVIVKLKQANKAELEKSYIESNIPSYVPWTIFLGLRYINSIAKQFNRPVVIYIPLGANIGAHTGIGIVEALIDTYSTQLSTVIVTNTGNQGNTQTHIEGQIENQGDIKEIELAVGQNQKVLPMQIFVNKPNIVTLSIVSPSGQIISNLNSKLTRDQNIKFTYEGTEMNINFISPSVVSGDTTITIKATNLRPGVWKFRLTGRYIVNGKYYAWIPQRPLIDDDTKFLNPNEDTTLTLPSTSEGAISVAYYDQNNNSIVAESGRGYTRDNRIKPDIAAGGVNATIIRPGGSVGTATGASVAGAVVSGCCALILQWAITDKNYPDIYSNEIKSLIIAGARTRQGDIYPNKSWGYGMFDMKGIFDTITEIYSADDESGNEQSRDKEEYCEYTVGSLFVRKPMDM